MRTATLAAILILAAQDKTAKRIPDGTAHKFGGVSYDVPKNWRVNVTDRATTLVPEGANPNGVLEEICLLVSDPKLKSIDGEAFEKSINEAAASLQQGASRQGDIEKKSLGELDGRVLRYKADTAEGKAVDIRFYAFMGDSGACALIVLGYPDVLAKRNADIDAIVASLAKGGGKVEASGDDAPRNAKRIPDGTPSRYKGIAFDVPKGWKVNATDPATALVPEGANPTGVLEEAYLLVCDPKNQAIEGKEFERTLGELVEKLQTGLRREGEIEKKRFGDLDGRLYRYAGKSNDGKAVEIRVHAFLGSSGACALVVIGYLDAISKRDADVAAILGSMWKPANKGGVREELAGSWCYMSNVNANDGGRMSQSVLTLNADGTYLWKAESNWSGPAGFGFTAEREEGTWSATDSSLSLKPSNGGEKTFELAKRNHPKNKNDPMIVLDGQCFVTTTQRPPW